MITIRPIFMNCRPSFTPKKPALRRLDEMVIFPLLAVAIVLIGIPLMMLFEICRYPRRPAAGNPRRGRTDAQCQ